MAHYIDKDALVAELERLYNLEYSDESNLSCGKKIMLRHILLFLDTIEVKQNDLVEEMDYADYVRFFKEHPDYNDISWGFEETWTFAQYCYKLGLKAQKMNKKK